MRDDIRGILFEREAALRMSGIETDYLVVGAGAAGMAFVDALITDSDADVVMVDRRHCPAGHWNDAYPFVRLHSPSALYGVNSRALGSDIIEQTGPNAGFYPRASAVEIRDYYQRVLDEVLLPSGQVRFFGMSDYLADGGQHQFASRLTGETTTVTVRRRVVDARFLEPSIPATHVPPFEVAPEARLIPVNELVELGSAASGFTILGGGKTAIDACLWLLESGVPPETIRWIRPRDPWLLDRAYYQPLDLLPRLLEGVSLYLEAAAEAEDIADLFRRLQSCGHLVPLDPAVQPTTWRCATVSQAELAPIRSIENVVRLGKVGRIGLDQIDLEHGSIPTDRGQVHVDCSASGLPARPQHPVFADGLITLQQVRVCQPVFSAALTGYVEASRTDDADKNRFCPANPYPAEAPDWIPANFTSQRGEVLWATDPDVSAWMQRSRLNATCGIRKHEDDPQLKAAINRYFINVKPAIAKLESFTAQIPATAASR
jgi:hypothetical protein